MISHKVFYLPIPGLMNTLLAHDDELDVELIISEMVKHANVLKFVDMKSILLLAGAKDELVAGYYYSKYANLFDEAIYRIVNVCQHYSLDSWYIYHQTNTLILRGMGND